MDSLTDSAQPINREQFWSEHVNSWRESGVSKRHYCQQHDLVYHQMIYWCAKNEDTRGVVSNTAEGFAQLAVSPAGASHPATLSIELPNGVTINHLTPRTIAFLPALLQAL